MRHKPLHVVNGDQLADEDDATQDRRHLANLEPPAGRELIPHAHNSSCDLLGFPKREEFDALAQAFVKQHAPPAVHHASTEQLSRQAPTEGGTESPGDSPHLLGLEQQVGVVPVDRPAFSGAHSQGKLVDTAFNIDARDHLTDGHISRCVGFAAATGGARTRLNNPKRSQNIENGMRSLATQVTALTKANAQLDSRVAAVDNTVVRLRAEIAALPALIAAQIRAEVPLVSTDAGAVATGPVAMPSRQPAERIADLAGQRDYRPARGKAKANVVRRNDANSPGNGSGASQRKDVHRPSNDHGDEWQKDASPGSSGGEGACQHGNCAAFNPPAASLGVRHQPPRKCSSTLKKHLGRARACVEFPGISDMRFEGRHTMWNLS